jgi:hypothetical protein
MHIRARTASNTRYSTIKIPQKGFRAIDCRSTRRSQNSKHHPDDCCPVSTVVDPICVLDVGGVDTNILKAECRARHLVIAFSLVLLEAVILGAVVEGLLLARCLGWCGCGIQRDVYGKFAAVCEGQTFTNMILGTSDDVNENIELHLVEGV